MSIALMILVVWYIQHITVRTPRCRIKKKYYKNRRQITDNDPVVKFENTAINSADVDLQRAHSVARLISRKVNLLRCAHNRHTTIIYNTIIIIIVTMTNRCDVLERHTALYSIMYYYLSIYTARKRDTNTSVTPTLVGVTLGQYQS